MAFMTPIMKEGWNLYNVHPPVKLISRRPKKSPTAATGRNKGFLGGLACLNNSTKPRRASLHTGGMHDTRTNTAVKAPTSKPVHTPVKACHVNATAQGLYQLRSLSTDSLRFRDLNGAMTAIPEEESEGDEGEGERPTNSESGIDTGSSSASSTCNSTAASRQGSHQDLRQASVSLSSGNEKRRHRLLRRLRKMFRLSSPDTCQNEARVALIA